MKALECRLCETSHWSHEPHAEVVTSGRKVVTGPVCHRCGKSVKKPVRGATAQTCSPACRQAAYRERKAAATRLTPVK